MASEVKELFGCPFCGFRVSTMEESCPRCGNKFTQETMFECPFCGDMVAPGSKECPSCHVDFAEFMSKTRRKASNDSIDSLLMDIIKLESLRVKREDTKTFSCPNCSWMLDGTEEKCPKCGHEFAEDSALQCPICGSIVDAGATVCPECGTQFEQVEVEVEKEDTTDQHEAISSALSDLLSSAGHTEPLVEVREPEPVQERPPPQTQEAPENLAPPEPERAPDQEPEPIIQKEVSESGPKKVRQRKLKTKPKS
jgi:RNA polymerase subunit RPABC4/transcription elongation factor Spt4